MMVTDVSQFRSLAEIVEDYIQAAIKAEDGNVSEAAKRLGVGRSTLYRRVGLVARQAPLPRPARTPRGEGTTGTAGKLHILKARVEELRSAVEDAARRSSSNYDLAMANGLIQALHIMEGRTGTPSYL